MNTNNKHTPGPWESAGELICAPHYDGRIIADIRRRDKFTEEEQCANARLMAAAPELLEALESAWGALMKSEKTPVVLEALHNAKVAISKAKGE